MPVYDQFEIEPITSYSSSYTDTITVFNPVMSGNINRLGIEIGTSIGGLNSNFNKVNLSYNTRLNYISGSAKPDSSQNLFSQVYTENELIYDSLPPSPASITNFNGYTSPYLNFNYRGQDFKSSLPASQIGNNVGQSNNAANVFYAGDIYGNLKVNTPQNSDLNVDDFVDQSWSGSPFPYKSSYKNLTRISSLNSGLYPEDIFVSKTPISGSNLDELSFNTREIGSLFIALGLPTSSLNNFPLPINQMSQIWAITGSSKITNFGINGSCNRPLKSWNNLNHVISFHSGNNNLQVAVGDYGTFVYSADNGNSWNNISSYRKEGQSSDNPGLIQYTYSSVNYDIHTGSIRAVYPVYNNISAGFTVNSQFRRWLIAGQIFNPVGSGGFGGNVILRNTSAIPTATGWSASVLSTYNVSDAVITSFASNNADGGLPYALSQEVIICVGYSNNPLAAPDVNPNIAEMHYSTNGGVSWTDIRPTNLLTSDINLKALQSVAYSKTANKFIVVGYDVSTGSGSIGRSATVSSISNVWEQCTGSIALNPDALYSIDCDNGQGSDAPSARAVAVGASGSIYYSSNINAAAGSVVWTARSAANGYTGTFKCVKRVYIPITNSSSTQIKWIACGENEEIQYTTNLDATGWQRLDNSSDFSAVSYANRITLNSLFAGYPTHSSYDYPFSPIQQFLVVGNYITSSLDNFLVSKGTPAALTGSDNVLFTNTVPPNDNTGFFMRVNDDPEFEFEVLFPYTALRNGVPATSLAQAQLAASYINLAYFFKILAYKGSQDVNIYKSFLPAQVSQTGASTGKLILGSLNTTITPKIYVSGSAAYKDALSYIKFSSGDENTGTIDQYGSLLLCKVADAESFYFNDSGNVLYSDGVEKNGFLRAVNSQYDYTGSISMFTKPKNEEIYKTFFGFGDGFTINLTDSANGNVYENIGRKLVGFKDISYYTLYKNRSYDNQGYITPYTYETAQLRLHGPILRGWRYGLYSGLPTFPKVIYRRNRYGQFRDVLESRTYTANLTLESTETRQTLQFPVEIGFVSGTTIYEQSRDYVTATNPSYNPYDSGIYDIYYRSGQPFFDRENED